MEEEWELPKEVNRRSCSQASNTLLDLGETYRTHSTKEQSDKHTTHKCARWGICTLCLVYGISKVVRFSDFTICHIQMCWLYMTRCLCVCTCVHQALLLGQSQFGSIKIQDKSNSGHVCHGGHAVHNHLLLPQQKESPYCNFFGECQFNC